VKLTSHQAEAAARLTVIKTEIEVREAELALLDLEIASASEIRSSDQTTLRKLRHGDEEASVPKPKPSTPTRRRTPTKRRPTKK
jgi:hypothetical protein